MFGSAKIKGGKMIKKELNIPMGTKLDLVALAVKSRAIRCKILSSGVPVTFKPVRYEVEGEILTVLTGKIWTYRKTHYMSGVVLENRIDIPALNLKPLEVTSMGEWDPAADFWMDDEDPCKKYFKAILKHGKRDMFEMEQIIQYEDPDDPYTDPILEAAECFADEDYDEAYKILEEVLVDDLRCLDAHAHLGNWEFNLTERHSEWSIDKAMRHYEVGLKIGEYSLGKNFKEVLPWRIINNRPFLRCLHGYGLSLCRLGHVKEAKRVFNRMLWLNPEDNQGARFLLAEIDAGRTFYESEV